MNGSKCFSMECAVSLLDKKLVCCVRYETLGGVLLQENKQGQGGKMELLLVHQSYFPINL